MKKILFLVVAFLICRNCIAQDFINGSLENWASAESCENNITPDNWSNYSTDGVGPDEVNALVCPATFPSTGADGSVYSRLYSGSSSGGEGMFQYLSGFVIGDTYEVKFDYAGCSYLGGTGQIQFHLFIDDVDVNQTPVLKSSTRTWTTNTFNFTASQGSHKIGVRMFMVSQGASGAIDNFKLRNTKTIEDANPQLRIECFPNPFGKILKIKVSGSLTGVFTLFDAGGKLVYTGPVLKTTTIRTDNLAHGMYFYELRSEYGSIQRGKLVKAYD